MPSAGLFAVSLGFPVESGPCQTFGLGPSPFPFRGQGPSETFWRHEESDLCRNGSGDIVGKKVVSLGINELLSDRSGVGPETDPSSRRWPPFFVRVHRHAEKVLIHPWHQFLQGLVRRKRRQGQGPFECRCKVQIESGGSGMRSAEHFQCRIQIHISE